MLPCTVCGEPFAHAYHCSRAHPGICHGCSPGFAGAYGYYDHDDPQASPPQRIVLSPRDVQALGRYLQHVGKSRTPQAEDTP